ncbi:hypothetical protein HK096_007191 [Nowakowskiella sp. JEL0078]|nr:hypothetical protein HK096_007191 [Nowakowskiella sp. JEL0078]
MTFWNLDSNDANVVESAENAAVVAATVAGWVNRAGSPSMISLQHDINTFTSGIAVNVIKGLQTAGTGGYKVATVAQCVKSDAYQLLSNDVKSVSTSKSISTTASSTTSSSTGSTATIIAANDATRAQKCSVLVIVALCFLFMI